MKNNFGWMQLASSSPEKAKDFYGKLFDWSLSSKQQDNESQYIEVDAGDGPCAGIAHGGSEDASHWIPFVNVSNINPYKEKAESLGAELVVPITALGGEDGFYCVFIDPTGAVIGLWAPEK